MGETRRPGNYTCQTIVHTLKFQDVFENKIMINGIRGLQPTGDFPIGFQVNVLHAYKKT